MRFTLEVDDTIVVRSVAPPPTVPCLRGPAVDLVEALSIRLPLPPETPTEWRALAKALATVFEEQLAG